MYTFTELKTLFGNLSSDNSTEALNFAGSLINQSYKEIGASREWYFLEKYTTFPTVANQQSYKLPNDSWKVMSVTVENGNSSYEPTLVTDKAYWDRINATTTNSEYPTHFYVYGQEIWLFPKPSSVKTVTLNYHKKVNNLVQDDYTTGTITTASGTGIVGSGTSWTSAMAGRSIKITEPTGDGEWYKISSVTNATNLVLDKPYQGTSIVAGTVTYTIGDVSEFPEEFAMLPVYKALVLYFTGPHNDPGRMNSFLGLYQMMLGSLIASHQSRTSSLVIPLGDQPIVNPNDYPTLQV